MFNTAHLHPMLVHFPIALLSFGFFFELCYIVFRKEICLTKAGFYLLLSGVVMGLFAVSSGLLFTGQMQGEAGKMRDTHELLAITTVSLAILTTIVRIYAMRKNTQKSHLKTLAFLLYGLTVVCVMATGFFGGTLVYNFMMPL